MQISKKVKENTKSYDVNTPRYEHKHPNKETYDYPKELNNVLKRWELAHKKDKVKQQESEEQFLKM